MNTAQVIFNEVNLTATIGSLLKGINGVMVETKRGPFANTENIIKSWPEFERIYGGELADNDAPTLCKRALERGSQLRVNKIGHYTDVSDPTTLTATKAVCEAYELVFNAAIVTSNIITITILGTVFTLNLTSGFTTSDAAMTAIAALIQADAKFALATVLPIASSTSNDRKIRIIAEPGYPIPSIAYTWTGGASQGTITLNIIDGVVNVEDEILFKLKIKYPGADYNNVYYTIGDASNGDTNYFDLTIYFDGENITETYKNLKVVSTSIAAATFLIAIAQGSELVDVEYVNTTAITGTLRPLNSTYAFNSGEDSDTVVVADYIGDAAGATGFHAFDQVDDCLIIAAPNKSDSSLHIAGVAYVEGRKDMMYFAHLANTLLSANSLVAARAATNIDSSYAAFYAGGLKILDSITGVSREISELGDVLGISAATDVDPQFGEWWSFAGTNRGQFRNALGVVNNFGGPGKFNDLNLLANRQINVAITKDNRIYLSGNFTATLTTSDTSFVSIRKLILTLKRNLRPTLEGFLEEPNDIPTWKAIYRAVKPYLDSMAGDEKRALFSYRWEGDQNASSITNLVINKNSDVSLGKYKVKLFIKDIVSLQEISIDITLTPSGVSFDDLI